MDFFAAPTAPYDSAAAEAFAETMAATLNAGAVSAMTSVGHRIGLFDVMAAMPPSTSARIAEHAGLSERYVREWLKAMVTGRVIEYDPLSETYSLPPERAACLTRNAPLGNLAVYSQFVTLVGEVQDRLLDCFRTGEGTRYGEYPCFHQIMAEDSDQTVTASLFEHILPLAEGIMERLDEGIDVLDAGCGRGAAVVAMALAYPESRFTGYDLCGDAIAFASERAEEAGVDNVTFEQCDMSDFSDRECYDFVTSFDAVHDQKDPQQLLKAIRGTLRAGGTYLMQDIGGSARLEKNMNFPLAPLLYAISCAHCMPVSLGQGGKGLGTMWGWETALTMLEDAGFRDIRRNLLPHDPMNVWFVANP